MAVEAPDLELKLIQRSAGVELDLLPLQGLWTEAQYLKLTDQVNHIIEFTDGTFEVLPMPTPYHQKVLASLYRSFFIFLQTIGGVVLFAPLRLQIRPSSFREPDLLVLRDANDPRQQDQFWLGADLVVEIVSPDNPDRDTKIKRVDYEDAGIPEYWIVNPIDETITVLTLDDHYVEHGVFRRGETASSALLSGFSVGVDNVFDAR